jgi:hypothetical protein
MIQAPLKGKKKTRYTHDALRLFTMSQKKDLQLNPGQ